MEIYLVNSVIKLFNNQALQIISERPQNCTFEVQLAFNIAENLIIYNCNCLFYQFFLFYNYASEGGFQINLYNLYLFSSLTYLI